MSNLLKMCAVAAVGALAMQGCRCGIAQPPRSLGEVRIVTVDAAGNEVSSEDGLFDFGTVTMGQVSTKKIRVDNVGLGTLTVLTFLKPTASEAPTAVTGTAVADANPVFNVAFGEETAIASGSSVTFDVSFAPPVEDGVREHAYQVNLVMRSGDVEEGKEDADITLKGNAVSGLCELPETIDFGAVAIGDSYDVEFDYANPQPIDTHAYLGVIESQQGDGIFKISDESPKGDFVVASMRTKTAKFTFRPTEGKQYRATVRMKRGDGCPEKNVRLLGDGVTAALSWTPATVDFGYAPPGTKVVRDITFSNLALRDVTINAVSARDTGGATSATFKVSDTGTSDLTKVVVPKGTREATGGITPGTITVKLEFSPLVLGPRNGSLIGQPDLATQMNISILLRGIGGGADIDVQPSPTLNFGRIAFFQNASPASFSSRRLSIANVGTRPNPPDSRANLKLGKPDSTGAYVGPYWEVKAINGDVSELCIGAFDTASNTCLGTIPTSGVDKYDPAVGIEAGTAGRIQIPIRITPTSLGQRTFEVTFFSNDADEAEVKLTVSANVVDLPPCDVEIVPAALQYGIVSPPTIRDQSFTIRNKKVAAGEICLLSNLALGAETGTPTGFPNVFVLPADFSTATNPLNEYELQPGETKTVTVRAWPQGQTPSAPAVVNGSAVFNMSSPTIPEVKVALTATIANSCLTISPSSLDFGTVKKDCNSATRTFQIYNTCPGNVVINSSRMGSAAGEGPGGPNCSGSAPCPEFFVVSGIPTNTTVPSGSSTPLTFSLRYRPINYGSDTGAFVITATQNSQQVDYVVALQGKGDMTGLNTDTFRQDGKPKADILLVIDDSGSMGTYQQRVRDNMDSFLQYATANQVDFQIAVTNTEQLSSTKDMAGIAHKTAAGNKILTPTTANLRAEFGELVQVGTSGGTESCLKPAYEFLTPPNITDPSKNAGFLRPDAVLAVVCITDATDQSTPAPSFYLTQFLNVKGAQRPQSFSFNAIAGFSNPSPCSLDGPPDDGRYAFMVAQTNGVREDICTADWSMALSKIGKTAFGYRTSFFLNSRPDLGAAQVQVSIDGMPLPSVDPVFSGKVWEYDPATNSVNFESLYVPEAGKTLTIEYIAQCVP